MLALFEVLSFKGWLDIRDVLIKTLGPVLFKCFISIMRVLIGIRNLSLGPRYLYPHFRLSGLHDRSHVIRGRGHCKLFRE